MKNIFTKNLKIDDDIKKARFLALDFLNEICPKQGIGASKYIY